MYCLWYIKRIIGKRFDSLKRQNKDEKGKNNGSMHPSCCLLILCMYWKQSSLCMGRWGHPLWRSGVPVRRSSLSSFEWCGKFELVCSAQRCCVIPSSIPRAHPSLWPACQPWGRAVWAVWGLFQCPFQRYSCCERCIGVTLNIAILTMVITVLPDCVMHYIDIQSMHHHI